MKKNGLDVYLDRVSEHLAGSARERGRAVKEIRAFLAETPGVETTTAEQVFELLDPPGEFAEDFMSEVRPAARRGSANARGWIRAAVLSVILAAALCLVGFLGRYVWDAFIFTHGVEVEGEIVVIDPQEDRPVGVPSDAVLY